MNTPPNDDRPDRLLAALVDDDPVHPLPPDVASLRRAGRRRLFRERAAVAGAAAAVALLLPVGALALSGGDGDAARDVGPATQPPASATEPPTPPAEPVAPSETDRAERVRIDLPDGTYLRLEVETGEVFGEPLSIGEVAGREQVLYAVRIAGLDGGEVEHVSIGLRDGERLLRYVPGALTPAGVDEPDGVDLYDGYRVEPPDGGPAEYLLVGSAPGDVLTEVSDAMTAPRPTTGRSTDVFPGQTVFFDRAPWNDQWDSLDAAPLAITLGPVNGDDGPATVIEIRDRTWTG